MRGVTSIVIALALLALAMWAFSSGGTSMGVAFASGAAILFVRGLQGRGVTEGADTPGPIEFIRDPAGAIVDSAIDRIGDLLADKEAAPAEEAKPAFDPDAAIQRYLANRPESASAPPAPPAHRGFGRKGLGNA
jgi:hypothetical protein